MSYICATDCTNNMEEKRKKVSIYDIAKLLNISGSTVSRALKDHPAISKEVKALVKKTAREMNYKPNTMAVNLKRGHCNTIGVIVPNINRNFFSLAIEGIEEEANRVGYDVLICQSQDLYEKEKKVVNALSQGKVDGVIASLAAGTTDFAHFNSLADYGIPLVLFDRIHECVNAGMVTVDDYGAAYRLTQHLLEQGRRRIFHYAGLQHVSVWKNRCRGYLDALKDFGITVGKEWISVGNITREAGQDFARKVLSLEERPDALFCTSDFVALGAMLELLKQGVDVPQEIAVCGFANEPFDELLTPSLTSVNQFSKKMGQQAARMLIERLGGEPMANIMIEPELIIRQSSGTKIMQSIILGDK